MEGVYLALIAAFAASIPPLIMALVQNRSKRLDKAQDYAREDAVAAKVDAAAVKAAEAARLLLASNERVAATSVVTNAKLDVIHVLVNSSMTAAMQAELDARQIGLTQMMEIIELKKAAGLQPTSEVIAAGVALRAKIAELEAKLADRLKQSKVVAQMPKPTLG